MSSVLLSGLGISQYWVRPSGQTLLLRLNVFLWPSNQNIVSLFSLRYPDCRITWLLCYKSSGTKKTDCDLDFLVLIWHRLAEMIRKLNFSCSCVVNSGG